MLKVSRICHIFDTFKCFRYFTKMSQTNISRNNHSLHGRSILNPQDFNLKDIKSILWTAIELKDLKGELKKIPDVYNKWVTFLSNQDFHNYHSLKQATHILGINLTTVTIEAWEEHGNLSDLRRFYARLTDCLLTKSLLHEPLTSMYQYFPASCLQERPIPMFNISSQICCFPSFLTDLLIYQEHFGRLLGLNLIWFGEVCTLLNTYIPLARILDMKMRYNCNQTSPASLFSILADGDISEQIREYDDEKDRDYKVDVVMIRERSPSWEEMRLMFRNHSPEMIVLRAFPRSDIAEPTPEDMRNREKHFERTDNLIYIMAAILLQLMCNYKHKTPQPSF